ncbi:hypothetical protein OG948_01000 [Embleya sp. NBC_00888]|uniref:hypothetical protein n=1 Tax=Embleya sp. NBC_00888 TaxID=2975960 RepID=UPI003864D415|nr:hypothetical protein OG948_01000 [Embleya sp. NBC_00888]
MRYSRWSHGEAELAVRASAIPYTFVRSGGFATNRLLRAESIRGDGVVHEAFPDSSSALIHEADIAPVAGAPRPSRGITEPSTP